MNLFHRQKLMQLKKIFIKSELEKRKKKMTRGNIGSFKTCTFRQINLIHYF